MSRSGRQEVVADADAKPGAERDQYSMYAFGAQFAEVRVDADLGHPRVSRLIGVFGAGKILNAKTARSQFIGGMVFGVGPFHEMSGIVSTCLQAPVGQPWFDSSAAGWKHA